MPLIHVVLLTLALAPTAELYNYTSAGDHFGYTVAIDGNVLVVGSPLDDEKGKFVGSVTIYRNLSFEQKLYGLASYGECKFGEDVDISGNTLVVGVPGYSPHGYSSSGCVMVFTWDGSAWICPSPAGGVFAPNMFSGDQFGLTVALDGDWLAVGSQGSDNKGLIRLFKWNGSAWAHVRNFSDASPSSHPSYAKSEIDLDGNWLVVGESMRDSDGMIRNGAAHVYRYNGAKWVASQMLIPADSSTDLRFGEGIAVQGTRIVVGAIGGATGRAYVFDYNGTNWIETFTLTAEDGATSDRFGCSVDIDGKTIVVGAEHTTGLDGDLNEGSAYVFIDGTLKFQAGNPVYRLTSILSADAKFGWSVAASGNYVVAGIPGAARAGAATGEVCVFTIPPEVASLVFTTQPSSIQTTGVITPSVTAYDQYGQVFTTPVSVTVSLSNNPTGASLIGTTTVTTSGGVASYSLGVSEAGTGYVLQASTSSLTATSSAFNVTLPADPATKFVILNPIDGTVGNSITVTVQAQTWTGLVVATYQTDVTLVASGSATGGLVNIVNGQGTRQIFDTVAETVILTLQDTQGSGLDVSSTQNVVFGVGNAAKLMFGEQPSGAEEDAAITPPIVVSITDQFGNLRSDTGITISVALTANAAGAVTYGTVSVVTSGGDATFANVLVDKAGAFTMTATSDGLMGITSTPFTITTAPVIPDPDDPEPPSKHCGGGSGASCLGWLLPFVVALATRRR